MTTLTLVFPSLRRTLLRCALAIVVAGAAGVLMVRSGGESTRQSARAASIATYLERTPVMDDLGVRAGSSVDDLSLPGWPGVRASLSHAEMRVLSSGGTTVERSPWMTVQTGGVGRPLVFTVQALASDRPAQTVDRRPVGKMRDYELERAVRPSPAQPAVALVQGSPRSPVTAQVQPDGSVRVSVAALAGDSQTAWAYPQSAERVGPNGAWRVTLAVAAAPTAVVTAYRDASDRASNRMGLCLLGFFLMIGSLVYGGLGIKAHRHGGWPGPHGDLWNGDLLDFEAFFQKAMQDRRA